MILKLLLTINLSIIVFDFIFHASGTGTTKSGLILGMLKHKDIKKIVSI